MKNRTSKCYAIYKGDKFLDLGTIQELAKRQKVSAETIRFYSSQACRKRAAANANRLIVIRVPN